MSHTAPEPLAEWRIVRKVAAIACDRLTRRVIRDLQKRESELLSGEDSPLRSIWDELCVQLQSEPSYYWDAYEETIRAIVKRHVDTLPRHELEAIWLQTDAGDEWCSEEEEMREPTPVNDYEVVEYLLQNHVYDKASFWTNERIRTFLD